MLGAPLLLRTGGARAHGDVVWVLPSDDSWAYAEVLAALQENWLQLGAKQDLLILKPQDLPSGTPPVALVTLGAPALRVVTQKSESFSEWRRVPVLSGLLPRDVFKAVSGRAQPWVSAAYLDQPVDRYLVLIRRAMPRLSKVGVLVHESSHALRESLIKESREHGLSLIVGVVSTPDSLSKALRSVLDDAQVLLMLPDSIVSAPSAVQHMLMAAYRQRVPVVGYSPGLVKAGAAVGLYASPSQVGRQLAEMLKSGLIGLNGNQPAWPEPRAADGFTVAVNEQVCRSLALDVPSVPVLTDALRREENKR